jgi:hypothetical protein
LERVEALNDSSTTPTRSAPLAATSDPALKPVLLLLLSAVPVVVVPVLLSILPGCDWLPRSKLPRLLPLPLAVLLPLSLLLLLPWGLPPKLRGTDRTENASRLLSLPLLGLLGLLLVLLLGCCGSACCSGCACKLGSSGGGNSSAIKTTAFGGSSMCASKYCLTWRRR